MRLEAFPAYTERSKPAVPLGGKYRLIDVPVSNCINSDITQIFVLTQYNSASLNRHISQTYRFSSFSSGFVEILAAEQRSDSPEWFQGTADAVRQIIPHLRDWQVKSLLILSGDHLYRMDYRKFLDRHHETAADVTISVVSGKTARTPENSACLKPTKTARSSSFSEKPKGEALESMRVDTTSFGLTADEAARGRFWRRWAFTFSITSCSSTCCRPTPHGWISAARSSRTAIDNCNVQAHMFDGYWEDIGTIRAFYEANLDLASPLPKFNFFNTEAPIYTRSRYLPPSKLHNCDIDNSMVSEGCILNGVYARNSIIGLRSRIDAGATDRGFDNYGVGLLRVAG